ncbi:phosphatidylserine/phosphatidylglycerophosphate/cardiolipin synthase-like enzyme [Phycicoccus badiiscoriae]|uniref:Phosphatidylserine/phosphatidylglycerophosphate/ cardiolipin synthase-like enzyme n=1 Tax=Pedococcus badiiscoriae TaxID=642776 RepID=A0A852WLT7_9MICO|nr:phospholipase D-like domain-containing protein DpdK [Pedococcus badiiscoriae]NYG07744.1 phosphatidylserine/phosphatidylglycerophosphate/cardiolipin synthase-like enzyme [Pedococcus badiiscoriae]
MRRITTSGRGHTRVLNDLMQNLLATELLVPSRQLWVLSPWISDIDVIDNTAGQFKTVLPGLPSRKIRFTEVLIELARRGCDVRVLTRDAESNVVALQRLENVGGSGSRPTVRVHPHLHDKGILGDRFHLQGSMNFTFFGQAVNAEGVTLTRDPHDIAEAHIAYNALYESVHHGR